MLLWHIFYGSFWSRRAENRQEYAQDSSEEYGETGAGREDEENPKARDEWKADETDSIESVNKNTVEETPAEADDSCTCQRRWNSDNLKLPLRHLPEEDIRKFLEEGVPLHKAILYGDLLGVKLILRRNSRTLLCSSINGGYETALHVAVEARQAAIVKELSAQMKPKELELQGMTGSTAFCIAAATGCVKLAKILMERNSLLPLLRGAFNKTPLTIAAIYGHPDMIRFLFQQFEPHIPHLNADELEEIFFACIHAGLSDLAVKMLRCHPNLAWARKDGETALGLLARMPPAFASKSTPMTLTGLLVGWGGSDTTSAQNLELTKLLCQTILSDNRKTFEERINQISEVLFEAARLGNYNFLNQLVSSYPNLISKRDANEGSIFHIAVLHRQISIFKQIYKIGLLKDTIVMYEVRMADENKESQALDDKHHICYNMLHLAAKLPPSDRLNIVSGAALQMQRELQWFTEVEILMPPSEREKRDSKYKLTPRELFTKEHTELRKAGEEWMKNTAQSCMVVATLVTAVVFTVTSSLPGGNDPSTGTPVNIDKTMFHVFAVADAVALHSSIIATLMFLSIFTSRYAENDFLVSLPLRLAAGITALLLSTMGMMVAFAAIFFLAYGNHEVRWVPVLASAMSSFPVIVVFVFQYQVVCDVFRSTLGPRKLFRPCLVVEMWKALF